MRDKFTTKLAGERLMPLIKYVADNRGSTAEVQRRLKLKSGKQWNRENVQRWLHPEAKKRTQPLFGVGLLLVEIGQELLAEQTQISTKDA